MRKYNTFFSALIVLAAGLYVSVNTKLHPKTIHEVRSISYVESSLSVPGRTVYVNPKYVAGTRIQGDMGKYLKAIARAEGGHLKAVNQYGYMGKYQFGAKTLAGLGIHVSRDSFLANERLQDSAMILNLRANRRILGRVIREYNGTWKDGIYITTSGILAGAHLVGAGGVLAYFYPEDYSHRTGDANGTQIVDYLGKFSGYRVSL